MRALDLIHSYFGNHPLCGYGALAIVIYIESRIALSRIHDELSLWSASRIHPKKTWSQRSLDEKRSEIVM